MLQAQLLVPSAYMYARKKLRLNLGVQSRMDLGPFKAEGPTCKSAALTPDVLTFSISVLRLAIVCVSQRTANIFSLWRWT